MAEIRPFRALRYNLEQAGSIQELTCPPYDIISEEQRREYLSRNGCNIIRLELPKEGENPYEEAARTLCVTINPVSAYGWRFDKDAFMAAMTAAVDAPVINVKEELR